MSGMDGIGPGRRPIRPSGADGVSGSKKVEKAGEGLQVNATPEGTAAEEAGASPRFDGIKKLILKGVGEDLSKSEVLSAVIDDEVRQSFGSSASEEMVNSIAKAFDDNEQLKALFDRLYGQALRDRNS